MHWIAGFFRSRCYQSVKVLYPTIMFLIYVVGNKQQVYYWFNIILKLRQVNRKYDFFIPKNVNTNIIVSLKLAYYISIGREFHALQSSFSDCSRRAFVILSESLSTGFNALVIHHLKHSSSSFSIFIIAFLLAKYFGNGI